MANSNCFISPFSASRKAGLDRFEALLRWRHPERGIVPPSEFIPVAEETGLIVPLGEWVLRTACAEAINWSARIDVAVNVSAVQLASGSLFDIIAGALRFAGLPPSRLILEITETIFLENALSNLEMLKSISKLGVQFSMDDFGAGYSSLTYLLSFPFNKIKIDQRFIAGLPHWRASRAIVRAIADLGRELNIRIVAEGVETTEQEEEVRKLGCTDIQGYLVSVPLPADRVGELIQAREINAVGVEDKVA
jgi:EAL domain-containing protein (putative c-di-GMP-specific phosphodiesterase class I)